MGKPCMREHHAALRRRVGRETTLLENMSPECRGLGRMENQKNSTLHGTVVHGVSAIWSFIHAYYKRI